jgi:hypothetical protein
MLEPHRNVGKLNLTFKFSFFYTFYFEESAGYQKNVLTNLIFNYNPNLIFILS